MRVHVIARVRACEGARIWVRFFVCVPVDSCARTCKRSRVCALAISPRDTLEIFLQVIKKVFKLKLFPPSSLPLLFGPLLVVIILFVLLSSERSLPHHHKCTIIIYSPPPSSVPVQCGLPCRPVEGHALTKFIIFIAGALATSLPPASSLSFIIFVVVLNLD